MRKLVLPVACVSQSDSAGHVVHGAAETCPHVEGPVSRRSASRQSGDKSNRGRARGRACACAHGARVRSPMGRRRPPAPQDVRAIPASTAALQPCNP
jgi:hypothetical protein